MRSAVGPKSRRISRTAVSDMDGTLRVDREYFVTANSRKIELSMLGDILCRVVHFAPTIYSSPTIS